MSNFSVDSMLSSSLRFSSQEVESEDAVKDVIPSVEISKGKEKEKRVKQKVKLQNQTS